jgi:hypothetical protein
MSGKGLRQPGTRDVKQAASAGKLHAPNRKPKHAGGRPSDYRAEYAEMAYKFTLLGATDKLLGEFFDVSEQTINSWKQKHPKFLESIKRGKGMADATVAASLFHRANGYSHKAVKIFSSDGATFEHEYIEHYPPDTTAAIFFLKNRRPDLWRDRQQLEHTGKDGGPIEVEKLSAADLRTMAEKRGLLNGHSRQ